ETGNLQKLFLQRRGNVVGHRHRICAGIGTTHLNDRVIDGRKIVDGELVVGGEAGDDHGERQQNSHDWRPDEWTGPTRASDLNQLAGRCVLWRGRCLRSGPWSRPLLALAIALTVMRVAVIHS